MMEISWLNWGFMDWNLPLKHYDLFIIGIGNTLALTGLAIAIGWVFSVPFAVVRANRHPIFNGPVQAFTYLFRGTPLLIQTFLIYYGLGQFEFIRESFMWPVLREPWWCALIAFSLNSCAYQTEILRGAIESAPFGEVEAASAAGMSPLMRLRRIILPSSLRRALPMYSNEIIFMLHGSVIASTITIVDILKAARIVNGQYYVAYEGFLTAAVLYMMLVFCITRILTWVEGHWHAHLKPRESRA